MKVNYLLILTLLLLLTSFSFGQSIDVETEMFPGTKKLIIESYNGCCAKSFRAIYYFDSSGRAIKSSHYFKRQLRARYVYRYNEKGLLAEEFMVYDINDKSEMDTTNFSYTFDQKNRVTSKTEYFGKWTNVETYSDFDTLNKASTVTHKVSNGSFIEKKQHNFKGQVILNQRIKNNLIASIEESKYNENGDKIYSNIPTLLDKNTGKMVKLIGGSRYSIIEYYEYTYDRHSRWTEKYVIFDNRKVLLAKRIYK